MSKILLIEGDKPLRDAMADALTAYGYWVCTARNEGEGISQINRCAFDVVIADMQSDDDRTWVLSPPHPEIPHLPIICISGDRQAALREAALEAGAAAYLIKPVTAADLHGAIEGALGLR